MFMEKYESKKKLEKEIKDNLFDMDSLLDLMSMEEYEDETDILQEAYENLYIQTEKYKKEYYKLCKELDLAEGMLNLLGA